MFNLSLQVKDNKQQIEEIQSGGVSNHFGNLRERLLSRASFGVN